MKIVIPGGTGLVGRVLTRAFRARGDDVVVLSRGGTAEARVVPWDGRTQGPWVSELEGADVVLNLAGRSVNCRYTDANRRAMMDSRVESTRAVGLAIAAARRPPALWLQMSTATIYAHRYDAPNDEATGIIGGGIPDAPPAWAFSIAIATAWEAAQLASDTPQTRRVALRMSMLMSPERGGVFPVLKRLATLGLGGAIAGGRQFVSWIHEHDFVRAIEFIIARGDLEGPVNVTAPEPLPQRDLMASLRDAIGMPVGLPATRLMAELGAVLLRTETELILKSRRVAPTRLISAGFRFRHPQWSGAVRELVRRTGD